MKPPPSPGADSKAAVHFSNSTAPLKYTAPDNSSNVTGLDDVSFAEWCQQWFGHRLPAERGVIVIPGDQP
jgi:hypothetical protein